MVVCVVGVKRAAWRGTGEEGMECSEGISGAVEVFVGGRVGGALTLGS